MHLDALYPRPPLAGFLPTFGPAWVNVYGARREWELLEGDKSASMNAGVEEGCAYRGRVLLALHTHVGSYPPAPSTAIDNDAFNAVRVSAGRLSQERRSRVILIGRTTLSEK